MLIQLTRLKKFFFKLSIQLETIGFERIPAVYRKVVLECINHLRQLTIIGCIDVDPIIELFPLNRLESLNIAASTLAPIANAD